MTIYKVIAMKDGTETFAKDRREVKNVINTSENTMTKLFFDLSRNRMAAVKNFVIEKVELDDLFLSVAMKG